MVERSILPPFLMCPRCGGGLEPGSPGASCPGCGSEYGIGPEGFLSFVSGGHDGSERLVGYADRQQEEAPRLFRRFLEPLLRAEPAGRVLDAGCGAGALVGAMRAGGLDAYGVDLPKVAGFWAAGGGDPSALFGADVTKLPFDEASFDLVVSFGVVEHIGTVTGHCTLRSDYLDARRAYASELLRVTRPGGRIVVSCPNKSFPVDMHHGPGDEVSVPGPVRSAISRWTGLNVHRTWGRYHLLSQREVAELFAPAEVRPLPLAGYFSFEGVAGTRLGRLAPLARAYTERLPAALLGTPFDPFVLAEIRR